MFESSTVLLLFFVNYHPFGARGVVAPESISFTQLCKVQGCGEWGECLAVKLRDVPIDGGAVRRQK